MTFTAPDKSQNRPKPVCIICGKPSETTICGACTDMIRAQALARKKQKEKEQ